MQQVFVFILLFVVGCVHCRTVDIRDFGAVPDVSDHLLENQQAISSALGNATSGDTVLIPEGMKFFIVGGVLAANLSYVTLKIDGTLIAVPDFDLWPIWDKPFEKISEKNGSYMHIISLYYCDHLVVTGNGIIEGQGPTWWNKEVLPQIFGHLKAARPKLLYITESENVLVENLRLHNSPSWTLVLEDLAHVEVRKITVHVDRKKISDLKAEASKRDHLDFRRMFVGTPLEPQDLNTDGIDVFGRDFWIHDCYIQNDDDSIAVKPCDGRCKKSDCTRDILIENTVLTGFGAAIGSVPPSDHMNCVQNVTFRNISMPETGKGIYIKSNPSCAADGSKRAIIADITYEDIEIIKPRWWPIWIGPQQQHQPGDALGEKCALSYPISPHCPTEGCVDFRNITLRRVSVTEPWLSAGVILGNETNPMQNVVFDQVKFSHPSLFPFGEANYKCENAQITVIDSFPSVKC